MTPCSDNYHNLHELVNHPPSYKYKDICVIHHEVIICICFYYIVMLEINSSFTPTPGSHSVIIIYMITFPMAIFLHNVQVIAKGKGQIFKKNLVHAITWKYLLDISSTFNVKLPMSIEMISLDFHLSLSDFFSTWKFPWNLVYIGFRGLWVH